MLSTSTLQTLIKPTQPLLADQEVFILILQRGELTSQALLTSTLSTLEVLHDI